MIEMLRTAVKAGIQGNYMLFDSWLSCLVTVIKIFRTKRKPPRKSKYFLSIIYNYAMVPMVGLMKV